MKLLLPLLFCALLPIINGANILVYIGMGSYSHRIPIDPFVNALADRGHKITFVSGFPPKKPNPKVNEFHPPNLLNWIKGLIEGPNAIDVFKIREENKFMQLWFFLPMLGVQACETLYGDPVFLKWMKDPSTKFDLVVMDSLQNECAYGFAHFFKAKLMAFNTGQVYSWNPESNYGIPDESSSIPDGVIDPPTKMTIFERTANELIPLVWKAYREFWFFPKLEEVTKKGLGLEEFPSFKEIEKNTSLVLMNNHFAADYPRSLPPNVVPVGGIAWHGDAKASPLPKNLDDFVKKGKDGFIYVSFGTVAEFTKFKPETRQAFINAFKKYSNLQFILKSSHQVEDKLPENVFVDKWLPQADILKHPRIRAYVTHGGLGGIYEAIFSKVPMICFPIFAEQEFNADIMVHKGYAIKLEITALKESELFDAIDKVTTDPSYKKQAERVSKMFTDRPMNPLDTAVWWTEFILRHDNINDFIRPLSVNQSWWVRRQLDVWILILLVTIVTSSVLLSLFYCIVKCTLRKVCGSSKNVKKQKTN